MEAVEEERLGARGLEGKDGPIAARRERGEARSGDALGLVTTARHPCKHSRLTSCTMPTIPIRLTPARAPLPVCT